jgi:glycosyltransferase involved in cell wall biosynthesis
MSRLPLSCFIISKNEGDRIARTIQSVKYWVDEVVVVDSESTDKTAEIAASEGCRVVTQAWLGFGPQKRFAEEQCRNPWVLNLDADEIITPALQDEIISLFANGNPPEVAYGMPLELVYPGADRPRRWARDHWYVRLYDRRIVRFRDSHIHDTVVTSGYTVGALSAPAYHHSFRDYADLKAKLAGRMKLFADHADRSSSVTLWARLALEFPLNFFKYYIVRRHITGGLHGFRYAWISAAYRHIKVAYMWQERNAKVRAAILSRNLTENRVPEASFDLLGAPMAQLAEFDLGTKSLRPAEICAERA